MNSKKMNKRLFVTILTIALLLSTAFELSVNAENVSSPKIYIEDNIVPLYFTNGTILAELEEEIFVPVREFVSYLGGHVNWDSKNKAVEVFDNKGINVLTITQNSTNVLSKNIYNLKTDNGVSYEAISVLATSLGYDVIYDNKTIRLKLINEIYEETAIEDLGLPKPNPFTPFSDNEIFFQSSPHYGLDANGVFTYDYGTRYTNADVQYNPSFISSYAFALYRDYVKSDKKNEKLKEDFLTQADWLVKNKIEYENFAVWEYNFDNLKFEAYAPWRSAMANGRVLSVMSKAYALTGMDKYLETAEKAYRAFLVDTNNYGVATFLPDGSAFYEEVADTEAMSSKILNGHIFALSGLYDYYKSTGRLDVKEALNIGIKAVENDLDLYDAGFLTYYSQEPSDPKIYAPRENYNMLHVHQLLWLYDISKNEIFLKKAMRFYNYEMQDYLINTKGSTNPEGYGPENLNLTMGTNYWSHNEFPTWIEVDLRETKLVNALALMGYTPTSSPKDMEIWYSINGEVWNLVKSIENNNEQYKIINFNESLEARYFKIDILSDNGNNNVAMTGIGIITPESNYELAKVITNFSNFSAGNTPYKIQDGKNTIFSVKDEGWIIMNLAKLADPITKLTLFTGLVEGETANIKVFASEDLSKWQQLGEYILSNNEEVLNINAKGNNDKHFIKVTFPSHINSINEIKLE